jgi:hypothetical protein
VYDMIADVTRMGEWSPECRGCEWDEGAGPFVGAGFSGKNVDPTHEWQTHSQIVAAERGQEIAWVVDITSVRWTYTFTPAEGGTRVTESWEFPPAAFAKLHELFGDQADARIVSRTEMAHKGIPVTLAALKKSAESTQ